jgi:hypothetical protein
MNDWRKAFWTCLALAPLILSLSAELVKPQVGVSMALTLIFVGALPLLAVAIFWSESSFSDDPLIRFGKSRRSLAKRFLAKKIIVLFTVAAVSSTFAQMVLYNDASPHGPMSAIAHKNFLSDVLSTLPVALAASISLACFFAFARSWLGKAGLLLALLGSWLFTPQGSAWGLSLPANHIRHLLAIGPPLPIPSWVSLIALYAMAGLLLSLHLRRVPR